MDISTCIHDLEGVKAYFEEQTEGCYPLCLEFAINKLKEMQGNDILQEGGHTDG